MGEISGKSIIIKPAARNFIGTFILSAIVLGIVTFLMLGLSKQMGFFFKGSNINILSILILVSMVISIVGTILPLVENIFTQEFEITESEVIYRKGFLTCKSTAINKSYIFSVEVTQSLYQKLVNTGDISVISGGYAVIQMKGAAEPFLVVEKYLNKTNKFTLDIEE